MVAPYNSQGNQRRSVSQSNAPASQSCLASLSENLVRDSGRFAATVKKSCFNCGLDAHLVKNCPYPKQLGTNREVYIALIQQLQWSHQQMKPEC